MIKKEPLAIDIRVEITKAQQRDDRVLNTYYIYVGGLAVAKVWSSEYTMGWQVNCCSVPFGSGVFPRFHNAPQAVAWVMNKLREDIE
jgi:hypothetical protein